MQFKSNESANLSVSINFIQRSIYFDNVQSSFLKNKTVSMFEKNPLFLDLNSYIFFLKVATPASKFGSPDLELLQE